MDQDQTLLVVGGGLAGAKAVEGARGAGFPGTIVLAAEEAHVPYERPPLSKDILRGEKGLDGSQVHDAGWYDTNGVELLAGRAVRSRDVAGRSAELDDGSAVAYGAVVLATGAAPRRLGVPGADLPGVHHLRTVDDAEALRDALKAGPRVVVVGAGWIGTEVAASAVQLGASVTLVDPEDAPLQRILGATVGGVFAALHRDHGVDVRLGAGVQRIEGGPAVETVVLSDGTRLPADVVVVGVGVVPRTELATAAGLTVDGGVVVDEYLRASAPRVFAAGDVASAFHPHYGRQVRVEHWANALNQGSAAGANAVGAPGAYTRLPYFFSDQYDLGLEYVGLTGDGDEVVIRGSLQDRTFLALYHSGGSVTAGLAVNVWDVLDDVRPLIERKEPVDLARAADPDVDLKEL